MAFGNIIKKIKRKFFDDKRFSKCEIMGTAYISDDTSIGEYCYVGYNTFITKSNIGRYCSIANNVSIGNGEHLLNNISTSSLFYDNPYEVLTSKKCEIGNDVWIGVCSTIRRGVKIGNGAVIGANSFVNKDVPPYAVVGGVPAKIIKYRFSEKQIEDIEKSNWWDFDIAEAKFIISQIKLTGNNI
ncbi:CatB-related O-acetyltransferase [Mucilaginibacter corticis]|uniref:CatB-related O-acetyltransferase n=1 Tax=Mucilaginibacter corticis TaxID=2597670 RepID=A0A556MK75_9SPHI|nr:CatB-related O-acetyltransferase [Mucilaginibacter corticis]TSJ40300.1 CatB-related O-acetyltransferase [Mucilaginibacter corticis]